MAEREQATAGRVGRLVEQYLAATGTVAEAKALDELVKAVNGTEESALTPATIERLGAKFRAATTPVERGNRLDQLAGVAEGTDNAALKWWVLEAVEAVAGAGDQSPRIAALEIFRWLAFPDEAYRDRVIDWVLGRIDATDRGPDERTHAVSACAMWVRIPRVRDRLLRMAGTESEPKGTRSLALDCFSVLGPGEAPASVIDACRRLGGDPEVGRTAARVLRRCGGVTALEPAPPLPRKVMGDVYWRFDGEPFAGPTDLGAAVRAYQGRWGHPSWHPERAVIPAARLAIRPDPSSFPPAEEPAAVEVAAADGVAFTAGELLLATHNAFVGVLRSRDHRYFEGLRLVGDPTAAVPLYEIQLGS